jgi:hypothetical protein
MSNNGLLDLTSIREEVTEQFVAQMLHSSPAKQERIIRLLLNRMPRTMIDALYIAQSLYVDPSINQTTTTQESEA